MTWPIHMSFANNNSVIISEIKIKYLNQFEHLKVWFDNQTWRKKLK